LVFVSDLRVSREDLEWMQPIRAEHDEPYYSVIDHHFTFVFPVLGFDREKFGGHVKERTDAAQKSRFAGRCATVIKDTINEYTHVFL
jgi:hypothetical protein